MLMIDNARERAFILSPPPLEGIIALNAPGRLSGREISTGAP